MGTGQVLEAESNPHTYGNINDVPLISFQHPRQTFLSALNTKPSSALPSSITRILSVGAEEEGKRREENRRGAEGEGESKTNPPKYDRMVLHPRLEEVGGEGRPPSRIALVRFPEKGGKKRIRKRREEIPLRPLS